MIHVRCLDDDDLEPTDSRFVASVTAQDGPSALQGAGVRFGRNGGWDGWNSSGGGFAVTHVENGVYDVRIEGQSAGGAGVQVTAQGFSPFGTWCNVGWWGQSGSDVVVRVYCWSIQWPSDAEFHLRLAVHESGPLAFAWADHPTSASYVPSTAYQWQGPSGSTSGATATRSGPGRYAVGFPDLDGYPSTAMVTPYTTGLTRCAVAGWSSRPVQVQVRCRDAVSYQPADVRFNTWARVGASVVPPPPPPPPWTIPDEPPICRIDPRRCPIIPDDTRPSSLDG